MHKENIYVSERITVLFCFYKSKGISNLTSNFLEGQSIAFDSSGPGIDLE
jgi:hypothetical protein